MKLTATPERARSDNAAVNCFTISASQRTSVSKLIERLAERIALNIAGKISSPLTSVLMLLPPTKSGPSNEPAACRNSGARAEYKDGIYWRGCLPSVMETAAKRSAREHRSVEGMNLLCK